MTPPTKVSVLIIGSGNAGLSAALSAAESGAPSVQLIDSCPEAWAGGNSYFTAGAFRTVHAGLPDILPLVNNVSPGTAERIDMQPYTESDFGNDIARICLGRSDQGLSRVLVEESNGVVKWLKGHGVRFQLSFNRQAYAIDGRYKFWGGMCLKTQDGGAGLVRDERAAAERLGVRIQYSTAAKRILLDAETGGVRGVVVQDASGADSGGDGGGGGAAAAAGKEREILADAVILAAGGFEANPRLRAQYLGPGWDFAFVRGTPYNTGSVLETAIRDTGAKQAGNWSGCHSVAWDANAPPDSGDRSVSNEFTKSGYPLGLMVNLDGKRFVDEGVDMRNYTYAIFGKAILAQPGHAAFQIWDATMVPWLRGEEYREEVVERITADTLPQLAAKCVKRGLKDPGRFLSTIKEYNEAVAAFREENPDRKWDPAVKDGLSTQSSRKQLPLAKSNWATPVTKGPFVAVKVTCGVTFTFGGLAVDPETAGVLSSYTNAPIPGLYCAGEMLGGLFYDNYPGGSGLTSGAVFGRRAGRAAAARVRELGLVRGGK